MNKSKQEIGKKNRKSGCDFERKVKEDLESKGWFVDRFLSNVKENKLISSKPQWLNGRIMNYYTGKPDFIIWKKNISYKYVSKIIIEKCNFGELFAVIYSSSFIMR